MNTIRLNTIGTPFPKAEGGGGDTPSGGSTIEYLDLSSVTGDVKEGAVACSLLVKQTMGIFPTFLGMQIGGVTFENVTAVAVDSNMPMYINDEGIGKITIGAYLEIIGTDLSSLPRITEEEFYSFETA